MSRKTRQNSYKNQMATLRSWSFHNKERERRTWSCFWLSGCCFVEEEESLALSSALARTPLRRCNLELLIVAKLGKERREDTEVREKNCSLNRFNGDKWVPIDKTAIETWVLIKPSGWRRRRSLSFPVEFIQTASKWLRNGGGGG